MLIDYDLKVFAFRKKKSPSDADEYKITQEIVGTVDSTFKFGNLCDFQYLPMVRKKTEDNQQAKQPEYESIYHRVFFDRLVDSEWVTSEEGENAPLFLPPAAFSRMDVPQDYQYRREAASDKVRNERSAF